MTHSQYINLGMLEKAILCVVKGGFFILNVFGCVFVLKLKRGIFKVGFYHKVTCLSQSYSLSKANMNRT
ncbi:hypothetical protein PE36_20589 [Moritella sp. PE36]|nr:hypothetical protein PE36_20589 [Moritella sp. PE36]